MHMLIVYNYMIIAIHYIIHKHCNVGEDAHPWLADTLAVRNYPRLVTCSGSCYAPSCYLPILTGKVSEGARKERYKRSKIHAAARRRCVSQDGRVHVGVRTCHEPARLLSPWLDISKLFTLDFYNDCPRNRVFTTCSHKIRKS